MRPIIIAGKSGTGKTVFIERVIRALGERGYRVGTIKHMPHGKDVKIDKDTDTGRHFMAGASSTLGAADTLSIYYRHTQNKSHSERRELHLLLEEFSNEDWVLIEGFKNYEGPIPKILCGRSKDEIEGMIGNLVIGYTGIDIEEYRLSIPYIPLNWENNKLAEFFETHSIPFVADLDCGECGYPTCRDFAEKMLEGVVRIDQCIPLRGDIRLKVNGKLIPMKGFVRDIFKGTIRGFVSHLHGYEEGKIEITIR